MTDYNSGHFVLRSTKGPTHMHTLIGVLSLPLVSRKVPCVLKCALGGYIGLREVGATE